MDLDQLGNKDHADLPDHEDKKELEVEMLAMAPLAELVMRVKQAVMDRQAHKVQRVVLDRVVCLVRREPVANKVQLAQSENVGRQVAMEVGVLLETLAKQEPVATKVPRVCWAVPELTEVWEMLD